MSRVVAFVDGFNLYHSLAGSNRLEKYRWLNIKKLCSLFLTKKQRLTEIYYFTALTTWNPRKVSRHRQYLKALRSQGVNIVYGEFKKKTRRCLECNRIYITYEEKQTDVNIAVRLLTLAFRDEFDIALILSGDSDLLPSITALKSLFPSKQAGILLPPYRAAESLKNIADFYSTIKPKHLQSSLFPDEIALPDGESIECPQEWRR